MKIKMGDSAVSEIVGTILLLVIAVAVFSVVYMNVLSDDGPSPHTYTTVVGKIENDKDLLDIVFEHQRGESLGLDTDLILNIAGKDFPPLNIEKDDLLDETSLGWNIGEKLVCEPKDESGNLVDLTDVQIKVRIYDKKTNSLIFWGTLQEGYTIPEYGRGGLWHFNESYWDGTSDEVKDSSGNKNHGAALGNATTVISNVSGLTNRSGYFNFLDGNDSVAVPDSYSLDLTNKITMEAWIKPFDPEISGMGRIEDKFGYTPFIVHGSENLFVIVSEDSQKAGMIQTVNITPSGQMSDILDKYPNFGKSKGNRMLRPILTPVSDEIYLVAYNNKIGSDLKVQLKTFNISSDGTIMYTGNDLVFNDNESDSTTSNRPSLVRVSDNIFAIAYWSTPSVGIIKTIDVSSDGVIQDTGNFLSFDNVQGYEPSFVHVVDDVFAVAYRGPFDKGYVKTFTISSGGVIQYTGNSEFFDDIKGFEPSFVHVVGDIFAVAYRGPFDKGYVKTFTISSDGGIDYTGNVLTFDSINESFDPYIIHHSEKYYVITYTTGKYPGSNSGNYVTIEIKNDGSIDLVETSSLFQPDRCYTPIPIKVSSRIFGVIYEGETAHEGDLILILVQYPSDQYSKGIYKLGSYGMYANSTKVFVNINTKTISANIVTNSWNHVALTYNKSASNDQMKLYVNGSVRATRTLTESIKVTKSKLIFGDLFYGLIDEVAIFEEELSYDEINAHYLNPGYFIEEVNT